MKKYFFFLMTSLLTTVGLSVADIESTQDKWVLLGTRIVDYSIDYDVVEMDLGEIFTALKIKIKEGSVNVHKSTIHFANGDKQDMDIPLNLTSANDGKVVLLDGNERIITKVGFWYDTHKESDLRGVIEVWGKK